MADVNAVIDRDRMPAELSPSLDKKEPASSAHLILVSIGAGVKHAGVSEGGHRELRAADASAQDLGTVLLGVVEGDNADVLASAP
jgi:hypothetical protein